MRSRGGSRERGETIRAAPLQLYIYIYTCIRGRGKSKHVSRISRIINYLSRSYNNTKGYFVARRACAMVGMYNSTPPRPIISRYTGIYVYIYPRKFLRPRPPSSNSKIPTRIIRALVYIYVLSVISFDFLFSSCFCLGEKINHVPKSHIIPTHSII